MRYLDFPVVRVGPGDSARGWQNGLEGVTALVVEGETILLFGGYGDERNRCRIGRLAGLNVVGVEEVQLELEDGAGFADAIVAGRASALHALVGSTWFRLDIADLR